MHGHAHHGHEHARLAADRRALSISLALLADAGHMLTDAGALGFALFAAAIATRPARGPWTFGFRRVEVLAAQANGVTLVLAAIWIVYSGARRLADPPE